MKHTARAMTVWLFALAIFIALALGGDVPAHAARSMAAGRDVLSEAGVGKSTPLIATLPVAETLTYGETLKDSALTGGEATFGTSKIPGSFAWKDGDIAPNASDSDLTEYAVVFTPEDASTYESVECTITVTVNKDLPSATAPTVKTGLVYTGEPLALVTVGSTDDGVMQYSLDGRTYITESPTRTDAGRYVVYYRVIGDANHYDTNPTPLIAEIKRADSSADGPSAGALTYTGDDLALVSGGTVDGGELQYALGVDAVKTPASDAFAPTVPTGKNAGDYFVWYRVKGDANHNDVAPACVPVSIAKSAINPGVTLTGWTYGDAANAPALSEGSNPGNGDVAFTYGDDPNGAFVKAVPTDAGVWYVKAAIAETGNYFGNTVVNSFSIAQSNITLTANSQTSPYGREAVDLTYKLDGHVVNGDDLGVTLKTEVTRKSSAGDYPIVIGWKNDPNYNVNLVNGTYTVTPAHIAITAGDKSSVFNEDMAELTWYIEGDYVEGDALGISARTQAAKGSDAGEYPIVLSWNHNINYRATLVNGRYTVARAAFKKADLTDAMRCKGVEVPWDGESHPLLTAPASLPEGYPRAQYSIDGGITWSDAIPTAVRDGAYTVRVKFIGDRNHEDFVAYEVKSHIYPQMKDTLILTMRPSGKKTLRLSWGKVDDAQGFDVFLGPCGDGACDLIGTVQGSAFSYAATGLKKYIPYKGYVRPWQMIDGKKIYLGESLAARAITGGASNRYTNPKRVTVKKARIALRAGKTARIKASVSKSKSALKLLNQDRKLRYFSTDTAVATVNLKGVITGVSPGTCKIYAVAINGMYKAVNVTVK